MEKVMIINADCELISINDNKKSTNSLVSLVVAREGSMGMKLMPDGNGNMNLIIDDKNLKSKITLKKCEIKHIVNYLQGWIEGDSWRE
ncbi:MAG: hypothetical protein ACOZCL_06785 [Bacillota bacterium]